MITVVTSRGRSVKRGKSDRSCPYVCLLHAVRMSEWEAVVSLVRYDHLYGTVLYECLGYWLCACILQLSIHSAAGAAVAVWCLSLVFPWRLSVFVGRWLK